MSQKENNVWACTPIYFEYVCVFSPVHFWPPPHTQTKRKKSNAYAKFLLDGLPNLRLSDSLKIFKLQKVKIFPRKVWRQADNGNEGMKRFHFLWIPTIIPFCQKLKKSEQHDKVNLEFLQNKGAQFPNIKVTSFWEGVSIFYCWFSGFVFYPAKSIVKDGWVGEFQLNLNPALQPNWSDAGNSFKSFNNPHKPHTLPSSSLAFLEQGKPQIPSKLKGTSISCLVFFFGKYLSASRKQDRWSQQKSVFKSVVR